MPASVKPQRSTERVVVLLKPAEKRRLEKVAKAQQVSSGEVLRRSFDAYEAENDFVLKAGIAEMHRLLDGMLDTLRNTREHVQKNLASIRKQREEA